MGANIGTTVTNTIVPRREDPVVGGTFGNPDMGPGGAREDEGVSSSWGGWCERGTCELGEFLLFFLAPRKELFSH